jgi:hypothetical protein
MLMVVIKTTMRTGPAIAAALVALTLSACSTSNTALPPEAPTFDPSSEFPVGPPISPGASRLALPSTSNPHVVPTVKPGKAVKIVLTPDVVQEAGDAYYAATKSTVGKGRARNTVISPTHTYYGMIVSTKTRENVFWLLGDTGYTGVPVSQQDGPHVWKKVGRGGIGWTYLGDTGGDPCSKVPMALIKVWGVQNLCPK